jgi:anti-sigma factor RsiW
MSSSKHPSEVTLALYAGGELDWRERIAAAWHVRRCERCRTRIAEYEADRTLRIKSAETMPLPANWDALAEEMTANIRLGLEASECIRDTEPAPARTLNIGAGVHRPGWYWKPAAGILAGMAVVVFALVSLQSDVFQRVWRGVARGVNEAPAVVLETSSSGIEVRRGARTKMKLLVGNHRPEQVSVNLEGSVRAQYVDDDSLQVTVTNVYAQ